MGKTSFRRTLVRLKPPLGLDFVVGLQQFQTNARAVEAVDVSCFSVVMVSRFRRTLVRLKQDGPGRPEYSYPQFQTNARAVEATSGTPSSATTKVSDERSCG